MAPPLVDQQLEKAATCLINQGYCLDVSGHRPTLLHRPTNRTQSVDSMRYLLAELGLKASRPFSSGEFTWSQTDDVLARLPRINGTMFRPVVDPIVEMDGLKFANTYRPPSHPSLDSEQCAAGETFLDELLLRLFPKQEEALFVRQYFAHMFINPSKRPQFALLLTGAQGTGKSLLIQCVERAFHGRHVWRENDYQAAFRPFSEVFVNHLLVTFDDAPCNSEKTQELLKHAITRQHQEVEIKGVQRRERREVFCRLVILTNVEKPFDLSEDRRFYMPDHIVHRESKHETQQFFHRFLQWFEGDDSAGVIYQWLLKTPMVGFSEASPPLTERKLRVQEGKSSLNEFVNNYVSDGRVVHIKEVQAHLLKHGLAHSSLRDVEKALECSSYVQRRRPHPCAKTSGQMIYCWVSRDRRRSRSLTDEEIARFRACGALD